MSPRPPPIPAPPPPIVLTVSGSDPSGGAGLEADLKTFHRHGVYGMSIPTLLTVQNTLGVRKVQFLPADFMEDQFARLLEDLPPAVIKVGAVGSRETLLALIRMFSQPRARAIPLVVDTVLASTSGAPLFDRRGVADYIERLLPLATLITPNLPEFALITGRDLSPQSLLPSLMNFGRDKPYAILLKGGHGPGDPVDYLLEKESLRQFQAPRNPTHNTHGTGCVLASAIAARLASGHSLAEAVEKAHGFVQRALAGSPGLGHGNGPLDLFAQVDP